jgi:hypothetical protein
MVWYLVKYKTSLNDVVLKHRTHIHDVVLKYNMSSCFGA